MKSIHSLVLALLGGAGLITCANGATVIWNQLSSGSASGSWNTAANPPWSTGFIPVAGDTADFSTLNITNTAVISLDGDQSIDGLIFGDTVTSTAGIWYLVRGTPDTSALTLTGSSPTITVNTMGTGRTSLDIPLAGTSGLIKAGVGTLTLTNLNTFTGNVLIKGGTLGIQLGDATLGAIPDTFTPDNITLDGGTLYNLRAGNIVGNSTLNTNRGITIGPNGGTFTVNNAPHILTIGGAITGGGSVTKNGAGTVRFNASITSVTGKFNVTAGAIAYGLNGSTFGSNPASFVADGITLNGGALNNSAGSTLINWTIPQNRGVTIGANGGTFAIDSTSGNVGVTVASVISGTGSLRKSGLGHVTLNAANTYTGGTTVSNGSPTTATSGAAIILGNASGLGSGAVNFVNSNSLTGLRYRGVTGGIVPNNIILHTNAALTNRWVIDTDTTVTFAGVISGGNSASFLQKDGTGTLVLPAANTCTGATLVASGKLVGVTGGSCSNSAVLLSPTFDAVALGVLVTDVNRPWTCSGLQCDFVGASPALEFNFVTTGSTSVAPLRVNGSVAFNTTTFVTVQAANLPVSTGNGYPLMTWTSMSGTPPTTSELTLQPLGRVAGTLSVVGNTLYLQITSNDEPLRWAAGSANWDSFSSNWKNSAPTPSLTYFLDGDAVQFEDTQNLGGGTIDLEGTVIPTSVLVDSTNAYTITGFGDSIIAGLGPLTKAGSGTLTLSGPGGYTYTGGLNVNGGTLVAAKPDGTAFGVAGNGNVLINTGATVVVASDNAAFGVSSSGGKTITLHPGASLTTTNASSRLSRLVLNGGSLVTLTANPTNGNWALDFGVATLGSNNVSTISGGNVALSQPGGSVFNILAGDSVIVSSELARTSQGADNGLTKQGAGTLALLGTNSSAGPTALTAGTLRLGNNMALPAGTLSLATATIASTDATARSFTNALTFGTGSSVTTFGDATGSGDLTFSGPAQVLSGTTGRGFVTTANVEMSGNFTGSNGAFTKTGNGRLTLSGNASVGWTGGCNINAGALWVNGSLVSTSTVTIANNAFLGGTGLITSPVKVNAGGTVAPGVSIGTLTISNPPALSGARVLAEINQTNSQTADKLVVLNGGLNFVGATLTVTNLGPAITNGTFTLFSTGNTGSFAITNLPPLPEGFAWDLSALAADGTIKVLPAKSTSPTTVAWSFNGNQLTLTWSADHLGWTLQAQTNSLAVGLSTNWVDVAGTSAGTNYSTLVDPASAAVFYRLRY